jgi:hypothetical protein
VLTPISTAGCDQLGEALPCGSQLSHRAASFPKRANASLARQFDAFVWFDETNAVTPLSSRQVNAGALPDTYPFGM